MDYQPYLGWGLNELEDIFEAFTKYPDGGWWVRKIINKDAFHREIVLGPYTEKNAKKDAREWNEFFKFKGLKTARAYSFVDLICENQNNLNYLKNYLYEEYIWKPPKSSELLCLIYKDQNVMMIKKNDNKKIKYYLSEKNIKFIEIEGYQIFYKNNILGNLQSERLKNLVKDYINYPEEMINLYNFAVKNTEIEPAIVPGYIKDFDNQPKLITINYFKSLNKFSTAGEKFSNLFKDLKLIDINTYQLPIVYNKDDKKIKNLSISYKNQKLFLEFKEDNYYVKLDNNQLTFNLDLKGDNKIIFLFLFIAKVLNLEVIKIKDTLQEYCQQYPLYINIVRFLAGKEALFSEIGFEEINSSKREEIISKYKDKKLYQLLEMDEVDIFREKTVKELANDYLDSNYEYLYMCQLLNKISLEIFQLLKNCCFEYYLDLNNYSVSDFLNKIN